MIVITLTDCPPALRGDLTKWLQEVNTGVYVGQVSARVRDRIWDRVRENSKSGRATLVFSTNNEQRMDFRIHNTSWEPIDFDGLKLILRPSPARIKKLSEFRMGLSNAARMHTAKQMSGRKRSSKQLHETYAVITVKTTGSSVNDDELLGLSAIIVKERQIESEFNAFINPKTPTTTPNQTLTDFSNEILEQKGRELTQVLPEFLMFLGELPVVSYNADLDYQFLRYACERFNLPLFSNQCVDTLALARRLVDGVKNYKFETLLEYFNVDASSKQGSMQDCLDSKQLYEKLIELHHKK